MLRLPRPKIISDNRNSGASNNSFSSYVTINKDTQNRKFSEWSESEADYGYHSADYRLLNLHSPVYSSTKRTAGKSKFDLSIIGEELIFQGPFGQRKCVYLDQTASNRAVVGIEQFIQNKVLPVYANTHTTTSYCASQITSLREEARRIIHNSCGCDMEDEVIFTGSGSTGAIHKLIGSLINPNTELPPIVILGPFEHHSNILPWREITNEIIPISENSKGFVNLIMLDKTLKFLHKKYGTTRLIVGSFSAGSNVTGVLSDDVSIAALLHKYGAYSIWDYAAAGPHVNIVMNPKTGDEYLDKLCRKDAIVFSGHKYLGGAQTPGILIAKRFMFHNPVPHGHGGGTVHFVTRQRHQYSSEITEKNEGGTPDIVGAIRLGLVFQLRNVVGIETTIRNEMKFTQQALSAWAKVPEIKILGQIGCHRLPIISFMIQHLETGSFLHHDFVTAVLNDLFGIQTRGGCMCAGPYGQSLLRIDDKLANTYEQILSLPRNNGRNCGEEFDVIYKPGFTRISLPYHATKEEIAFAIEAVKLVAQNGWKLLPFYEMNCAKATFRFRQDKKNDTMDSAPQIVSIKSLGLDNSENEHLNVGNNNTAPDFEWCLKTAQSIFDSAEQQISHTGIPSWARADSPIAGPNRPYYCWFLLPSEAALCMKYRNKVKSRLQIPKTPFMPNTIILKKKVKNWVRGSIPFDINVHG